MAEKKTDTGGPAKSGGEQESAKRRVAIIKELFREGKIDVIELAEKWKSRRRAVFSHLTPPTLRTDIDKILEMLDNDRRHLLERVNRTTLHVIAPSHFAYEGHGYTVQLDPNEKPSEKTRIARYIVEHILGCNEVLYLSTGTTVFQVAVELFNTGAKDVNVILTHNLPVIDYWQRKLSLGEQAPELVDFVILGGSVKFHRGEIDARADVSEQLKGWNCTKTIMSCTAIKPETGEVDTVYLPDMKASVLQSGRGGTLVMPVTSKKLEEEEEEAGGKPILTPKTDNLKRKIIVTSRIRPETRLLLEGHGFEVHEVDRLQAGDEENGG